MQNTEVWIRADCNGFMRFEFLTMAQLKTPIFWDVMLFNWESDY